MMTVLDKVLMNRKKDLGDAKKKIDDIDADVEGMAKELGIDLEKELALNHDEDWFKLPVEGVGK